MFSPSRPLTVVGVAALAAIVAFAPWLAARPAVAAEFRLENRVYADETSREAAVQSTTILRDDMAYDFMQQPNEVIIFDRAGGRLTLFDPDRAMRTDLTTAEVAAFAEQIRQSAQATKDPLIQFMAAPSFTTAADDANNAVRLDSPRMTYRAKGVAVDPADAAAYREFADWLARLNTLLNPGGRPPFARMSLNEALAAHNLLPLDVHISYEMAKRGKTAAVQMRSEHSFSRGLNESDRRRLADLQQQLATAKSVRFAQYRLRTTAAKSAK